MIEQVGGGQYFHFLDVKFQECFQLITTGQDAIDYNSVISYYN